MSDPVPQYVDSIGSESISAFESGSRIRLSANLLRRIDWDSRKDEFPCVGLFRFPGELLCAPTDLIDQDGRHPFHAALEYRSMVPSNAVPMLEEIPSALVLTATDRIVSFTACWSTKRTQLTLKLGVKIMRELGWDTGQKTIVHGCNWGPILILISENRYAALQMMDFTGGHMKA